MKILIPTYRRTESQDTFNNLPDEWKKEVVMVVDEQDAQILKQKPEFQGIDFWIRPERIRGIAQKRKWIFENILEDKIVMMDDDLSFEVRTNTIEEEQKGAPETFLGDEQKQMKTRAANKDDISLHLQELSKKLDIYAHAGFSVRRHNDKLPNGWFENSRIQCVLGFRPKIVRNNCELGRIELREDFDYTLQLLKKGFPNTICSDILFSQQINAPGGVSTYRTTEYNNEEAYRLEAFHPGLVKAIERKYKTQGKSDFGERIEVICYWKKAYEQGLREYGRQEIV